MDIKRFEKFLGQKSLKSLGAFLLAALLSSGNAYSVGLLDSDAWKAEELMAGEQQEKSVGVLGVVLDEESQQPLSGAVIMVDDTGVGTVSLNNGYFMMYVKRGMKLHVSASGFHPAIVEVNEEMMNLQVVLRKDSTPAIDAENLDEQASFPGGISACGEFISKNLNYPQIAAEHGIQGKVLVGCVIDVDGAIVDVKVVGSVDPYLDREAVRVVKLMPKWIPGKKDGKPVRVRMTIPIKFQLEDSDPDPLGLKKKKK